MNTTLGRVAVTVFVFVSISAFAQSSPPNSSPPDTRLPDVVVTGNPLGSELFELVAPVSVLGGNELVLRRASTLGETLNGLPGVSSSYFGPNASRPVIRGLDGDRIRILQNGVGVLDASAASFDHAVALDPLIAERVEVVRGPAALLYGGNAIGGVVNVIDGRIPQEPVRGIEGQVEARFTAGADREKAGVASFQLGNGRFALHADAHGRDTDDMKIPGYARSQRLRESGSSFGLAPSGAEAVGFIPNSAARTSGGALGGAFTWDQGYLGLAYSGLDSRYGTVAEPEVVIDLRSTRWDLAGEARALNGWLRTLKFKLGYTDYRHDEIDAGEIGTTFKNRGYDARLEAAHAKLGPLSGAFGMQLGRSDFSALGEEAFVPSTATDTWAAFVYEELALGALKLTAGARIERARVRSDGGGPADPLTDAPRFDPAMERSFSPRSAALGALYQFTQSIALAANLAYSERAPTFQELFANGPHAATGAYEIGDPGFGKERSKALDLALRLRSGAHSGSIGAFVNRFDRYLTLVPTGNMRSADGELNPEDPDEEILPEYRYQALPATLRGFEAQGRFRLLERGGTLDLELKADYVRAYDRSTRQALPRIAPLRLGMGLDYRRERLGARFDLVHARAQDRVAADELPTDGYTVVSASLSYRLSGTDAGLEAFIRANNLFDQEARNHVSFLKDIAPLPGRSVTIGLRGRF